ncbi:uncharacterized protein ASPGLDRAFT_1037525 [Aspergillus glaucus CBS 516.65]|uniref:Uncharacterized protein n=1 Tax=Aspergillus glaucus CBS 516.65 TaxID=1160497 RepID=A0A1L9VWA8_ASPGL|nr:hypothetical protein ASPGLDRAFT_1037525 [Aspergillus glaucus CBS 516.65]OJJ88192.1 hypothetical protein ASPGLDRAFT_1037525 [Aspergillus glaucus CBS 516.65]
MAILIERSRDRLRGLYIGIAVGCKNEKWTRPSKTPSQTLEKSSEWPKPDGRCLGDSPRFRTRLAARLW